MTGRGIDQILPAPGDHRLWERRASDARAYVQLAERLNGPIPRPVRPDWPWGDALSLLDALAPDLRIVNVETTITSRGEPARGKGIHYRMHPANIGCLTAARLDACMLANNHILDFGATGLADTLHALAEAGLPAVGAGRTRAEAARPLRLAGAAVVSCATTSSGVPLTWAATERRPGVDLLPDLGNATADATAARAATAATPDDIVLVSIHWGSNWGYRVPSEHIGFAHRLIDAGVDVVYGHSAHHPLPIEVYRGRLILYGCGDLIDDYEGIAGYERYRDDLRLLYLPTFRSGALAGLRMVPMQARRMRLRRASRLDTEWLRDLMASLSDRPARIDSDGLLTMPP